MSVWATPFYVEYSALIFTYSCVRSVVRNNTEALPLPTRTPTSHSALDNSRCAAFASNTHAAPCRHTVCLSIEIRTFLGSTGTPLLPTAARILPQFGSAPAQAVL